MSDGLRNERLDFKRNQLNEFYNNQVEKGYSKEIKKEQRKVVNAQREIAQANIDSWSFAEPRFDPYTGLEIDNNKIFIIMGVIAFFLFK